MIEYIRTITDEEQKILENDLIDIKDWIDKTIEGKLNNCSKRAAKQYDELAKTENLDTVPTKDSDKSLALFAHPEYKNRVQRETENGISGS